jgi:hypothetical protein
MTVAVSAGRKRPDGMKSATKLGGTTIWEPSVMQSLLRPFGKARPDKFGLAKRQESQWNTDARTIPIMRGG